MLISSVYEVVTFLTSATTLLTLLSIVVMLTIDWNIGIIWAGAVGGLVGAALRWCHQTCNVGRHHFLPCGFKTANPGKVGLGELTDIWCSSTVRAFSEFACTDASKCNWSLCLTLLLVRIKIFSLTKEKYWCKFHWRILLIWDISTVYAFMELLI